MNRRTRKSRAPAPDSQEPTPERINQLGGEAILEAISETGTTRTVNGGTVIRNNAYIDMSGVSRLKLSKQPDN